MKFRRILGLSATLLLFEVLSLGQDYQVKVENGVRAEMRDGVSLVADIYRPEAPGTFPVLLQRTPYNRKGGAGEGRRMAAKGYIVIYQDTRGRYDSGGTFYPFRHETDDGYDTVEWAASLPGSNGKVGMFGGSYVGATQMLASIGTPQHLVAIFPYVTASEYYDSWTYQSGAFMQWFASSWTTGLAQDTLRRRVGALANPKDWSWALPVDDYRLLDLPDPDSLAPYYDDWVEHETDDDYWKPWKISDHYSEMKVKGLHAGGWHDIFLKGSIANFRGSEKSAPTADLRASQRLLIGPWAHAGTSPEGKIGDVTFGASALVDFTQVMLDWSDWTLKGIENNFSKDPPVRLFIMGENVWRNEEEFPLKRQMLTHYYLHSNRGANGSDGDGTLSTEKPGQEDPDRFEYDPARPVPTIGGRLCCGNAIPPGPFDQSPNESRDDVLVFSTPPLDSDLEVTGYIRLELYASTDAVDTDFTAILVDVDPSGYSRFLTDGISRARYRISTEKAELLTPGKVYKYEIDLWATSNVFKAGHRVRVDVSSSNFPRFNRNLNTGDSIRGPPGW